MRSRLSPVALVLASAALLQPRLAVADDAATPAKPAAVVATPAPLPLSPLSPMRAALAAAEPRPPVSAALVIAGGVTAGIGAVGALTGLLLMAAPSSPCAGAPCGATQQDAGRITLFVGAPVLAVGLAMVIVGIQPAADGEATARARLVPAVAVGPAGGMLRWRF